MTTLRGTGELVRLNLRLDRVRIPLWSLGVLGLVLASAASVKSLYPTPADVAGYVDLMNLSPNLVAVNRALNGPGYGFDDPNLGVVLANEVTIWGALGFALMATFLTVAHTRADEEAERTEVVRSRMVGRHAPLAAAAIVVAGVELSIGLVAWVGIVAMGFAPVGSAALCAGFVAAGLVFGAFTAVAAQVVSTARAALGLGIAAIGISYLVRAVGDMGDGTISWVSPIGWAHRVRPFAGEAWWVLGLSFVTFAVSGVVAVTLSDRRDLGSGLVHQRPGRASGTAWGTHPVGLAARLQRGSIAAWSIGLMILGIAYGAVGADIEQVLTDNPDMEQFIALGAGSVTDAYLAYTLSFGAMLASGFAIASVLRMRSEESAGRTELLLATPLHRPTWAAGHLLVSVVGSIVVLVCSGLGTGIGIGVAQGDGDQVLRMVGASLAQLPAILVLIGVAAACYGIVPRWSPVAWLSLVVAVVVGLFGELFRLPDWARWLSPLEHVPSLPAEPFAWAPELALMVVAVLLVAAGLAAFRRRDVPAV